MDEKLQMTKREINRLEIIAADQGQAFDANRSSPPAGMERSAGQAAVPGL